jgi:hypothetical protein
LTLGAKRRLIIFDGKVIWVILGGIFLGPVWAVASLMPLRKKQKDVLNALHEADRKFELGDYKTALPLY